MRISATEALARLRAGNRRFVSGNGGRTDSLYSGEQAPAAAVLGCSDSRVPIETILDQDAGDLFVVRVAGNIAGPSQIGSIEFAVEQFATSLVLVLGHSSCGAVMAAIDDVRGPVHQRSHKLQTIVDAVRPAVEAASVGIEDPEKLLERSVRANVLSSIQQLSQGSQVLQERIQSGELLIAGAEYSLETGVVEFLTGV